MTLGRGPALRLVFALVLVFGAPLCCRADDSAFAKAVAEFQNGDLASAEQTLRAALQTQPRDAQALELLAVVLDQEHKTGEAAAIYQKAIALDPRSPGLLNNYGNHLLQAGNLKEARAQFLKVEALAPGHPNATVQLARIALELKQPAEADRYLSQLGHEESQRPDVAILRMQADYALHRTSAADEMLRKLTTVAANSPQNLFRIGVALSSVGQYGQAEAVFSKALELQPGNAEVMHDLGVAASHAGHDERARTVLQQALEQQPGNVDILYDLAAVDLRLNDGETALALLARAKQAAPNRADIQFALAHAAAELGYFGDALEAWKAYLNMVPNDDSARREYAFLETAVGENTASAIAQLRAYVRAHPDDAAGHYELGTALLPSKQTEALEQLNRALRLKPDFPAAHLTLGLVQSRAGDFASALKNFEVAAAENPRNAIVLDHLGETELELNQTQDAVDVLRKAAQLAPDSTTILLHLGRALAKAGNRAEAAETMARYRDLGGARAARPHPAGLIDFLALSPEERQKRYRAGVVRTLESNPDNLDAEVEYLGLLLEDGKSNDAAKLCQKIAGQHPDDARVERVAFELIAGRSYSLAKQFLAEASAKESDTIQLDRAIAVMHVDGPKPALTILDSIPAADRNGDWYLARADFLYAEHLADQASEALEQALRQHPTRADLYRDTMLLLISESQLHEAQALADSAPGAMMNDPEWQGLIALDRSLLKKP